MMIKYKTESIRIVKFDDTDESEWRVWEAKKMVIGSLKLWEDMLDNAIPTTINVANPKDEKERLVIKNEKLARMYLTLAYKGLAFKQIIMKKTDSKMWEELKERYDQAR